MLHGNFYNRNKELIFSAKPKDQGGGIEASTSFLCGGDRGGIAFSNMSNDAKAVAAAMIATQGKIHGILRGLIEGKEVVLDGKGADGLPLPRLYVNRSGRDFRMQRHIAD